MKILFVCLLSLIPNFAFSFNPGVYELYGNQQQRGSFQGEIEIRPLANGQWQATQVLTYQQFRYQNLQVQEVWTGIATPIPAGLKIDFSLAQQDFIKKLNQMQRDPSKATPLNFSVILEADGRGGFQANFLNSYQASFRYRGPVGVAFYEPNRTRNPTNAKVEGIKRKLVDRMFRKFQDDEFIRQYRDRQEYKDGVHYMIHDRTDFEFYRANPHILRVANKVLDEISLVESLLRHNAFAPSLEEKGRKYALDIRRHIDSSGMYAHAAFDNDGKYIGTRDDGDSALWTGVYIAGEAFRYQTTRDPEALENMKRSLRGIMTLVEITGDPKQFARTLEMYDPNKPLGQGWHRGEGRFAAYNWLENGNNDMFKGLIYGMLFAHLYLPANEFALRQEMQIIARKINDLALPNDSKWNKPLSQGLVALITGDADEREKYLRTYDNLEVAFAELKLNDTFYFAGITDWSGLHLSTISAICAITLADRLGANDISAKLKEKYFNAWKEVRETDRHFMTIALLSFAKEGISPDYQNDVQSRLNDAIWGLREIPYPRPRFTLTWDHTMKPDWVASPFPRLPWKFLKDDPPPPSFGYQGIYAYPLFESTALSSNYIWKDTGFPFTGNSDWKEENGSVDYLHWYWLARYMNLVPAMEYEKVVSPRPEHPRPPHHPPYNPPVTPPPPVPPQIVAIEIGNGTTLKFIDKNFEYTVPAELYRSSVVWIRLSSNKEETDVRKFEVVYADDGSTRELSNMQGNLGNGAVKDVAFDGRPIREIRMKARSGNWRGSPGEFKITIGVLRR